MKWSTLLILPLALLLAARAQEPPLPVSDKFPLAAHIVSVETQQRQDLTNGTGETSVTHLVKAEIQGKTYRLSVNLPFSRKRPFQHRMWLRPGDYPTRRTARGFEFEYRDGDKVRHEELHLVSVE